LTSMGSTLAAKMIVDAMPASTGMPVDVMR
jgi:hypothetical protein